MNNMGPNDKDWLAQGVELWAKSKGMANILCGAELDTRLHDAYNCPSCQRIARQLIDEAILRES